MSDIAMEAVATEAQDAERELLALKVASFLAVTDGELEGKEAERVARTQAAVGGSTTSTRAAGQPPVSKTTTSGYQDGDADTRTELLIALGTVVDVDELQTKKEEKEKAMHTSGTFNNKTKEAVRVGILAPLAADVNTTSRQGALERKLAESSPTNQNITEEPLPTVPLQASTPVNRLVEPTPGAFRHRPMVNNEIGGDDTERSVMIGTEREYDDPDDIEGGLVQATPVVQPSETAEPMKQERAPDHQQKKAAASAIKYTFVGASIVLFAVGVLMAIFFLVEENRADPTGDPTLTSSSASVVVTTTPTTAPTTDFWTWDLPFDVPNTTISKLYHDENHTNYVSRAFQWIKNDPNLLTYSKERNLQRFVLVMFYYAMNGEDWTHQGNETATIVVGELGPGAAGAGPGPGQGAGPGRPGAGQGGGQGGGPGAGTGPGAGPGLGPETGQGGGPGAGAGPGQGGGPGAGPGPGSGQGVGPGPGEGPGSGQGAGPGPEAGPGARKLAGIPTRPRDVEGGSSRNLQGSTISYAEEDGWFPLDNGLFGINITSKPWLSYTDSECEWFSTAMMRTRAPCRDNETFTVLDLDKNNLKGILPEELGLLTSLEIVFLIRPEISGQLFTQIGEMKSLKEFVLVRSGVTGSVPSEVGLLSDSLQNIDLNFNSLSGDIPEEFWRLSKLEIVVLSRNWLSGTIPFDIDTHFPLLKDIRVGNNELTGTIHSSFGRLSNLTILGLKNNKLTGTIPTELGNLEKLRVLSVTENIITGTVPTEVGRLSELGTLGVDFNPGITGTIPSEIGLLTSLTDLRFGGNSGMTGTIPTELGFLNNSLESLELVGSNIAGTIPEDLCEFADFTCNQEPDGLCGCDCPCVSFNMSS